MDASDECPTEDAIQAFLDNLVDPVLTAKSFQQDTPSLSEQEAVAKQMHAVVLLYNYYHRKQCPKLEVLRFDSFCKLVISLKPALWAHMKFMKTNDIADFKNLEKSLSVTERTIMDACDIAISLDASKDYPNTEGWPISEVTVLLVDSKKENCLLQFGSKSMTEGVWSVIHKDLDVKADAHDVRKMKRVAGNPSSGESRIDEATYEKLAYSAIKEATGFSQTDLLVLESHVVYSEMKEKAASWFFIIQCTKSVRGNIFRVPIKYVIDSLQGPLVRKSFSGCEITTVMEYFHVLPYAEILSHWFSRRENSNGLQDSRQGVGNGNVNSPKSIKVPPLPPKPEVCKSEDKSKVNRLVMEDLGSTNERLKPQFCGSHEIELEDSSMAASKNDKISVEVTDPIKVVSHHNNSCIDGEISKTQEKLKECKNNIISSRPQPCQQKDTTLCKQASPADSFDWHQEMGLDHSSMVSLQNVQSCQKISRTAKVVHQQEKKTSLTGSESNQPCGGQVEMSNRETRSPSHRTDYRASIVAENQITYINSSAQEGRRDAFTTCEKLHTPGAFKENILSQTVLKVLEKRRNELSIKKRNIEDEISLYEEHIQTISNGSEDNLAIIVESLLEGCSDVCLRDERAHPSPDDRHAIPPIKRKRLSEAILDQNPRQELDGICCRNNWVLPTYCVSPSDGGFVANATVEGLDFKCEDRGDMCSDPVEAMKSAARKMLVKLQNMAGQASKLQVPQDLK